MPRTGGDEAQNKVMQRLVCPTSSSYATRRVPTFFGSTSYHTLKKHHRNTIVIMIPLQVEEFIVPLQSKPRAARGTPQGLPRCEAALPAPQAPYPAALLPYPPKALPAPQAPYPPVGPYTLRSSLTRAAGALPAAPLPYTPKALHAAKQLYPRRRRFTRSSAALNL